VSHRVPEKATALYLTRPLADLPNYDESFKTGVDTFTMSFSKVDQAGFFKSDPYLFFQ
jgi:hypothetical protein